MASIRTTLATAGTLAALGGLTAFAVGAGNARPEAEQAGSQAPAEQVRTEVVARTIHRRDPAKRAASVAPVATSASGDAGSHRRGRGRDDDRFDDHDGDDGSHHRGRGRDDDCFDDHDGNDSSGRGREGDDDDFDDHGWGDDDSGHGRGGDDD